MPEHHSPKRENFGAGDPGGEADLSSQFFRAFRAAAESDSDASVASFRAMVCTFVREARARGDPPERVLATLKHATIDSIDSLYFRGESTEQRLLRESIFRWFLDEYYRAD